MDPVLFDFIFSMEESSELLSGTQDDGSERDSRRRTMPLVSEPFISEPRPHYLAGTAFINKKAIKLVM